MRYCKSTSFQANHNGDSKDYTGGFVVCDTAKVRVFKQITTAANAFQQEMQLFAILQKYEFSSKSQLILLLVLVMLRCLRYCKSTSFQANHNDKRNKSKKLNVVSDTAKVRVFKQITTHPPKILLLSPVVCDTAKVRVFKQITTAEQQLVHVIALFAILQKYEFSSKSQQLIYSCHQLLGCLRYCKSTSFQANHNACCRWHPAAVVVCDTAKVRVFKQITTYSP